MEHVALGRVHAWQTLIVAVSETALAIELDDAESRVVRRTTATPVVTATAVWLREMGLDITLMRFQTPPAHPFGLITRKSHEVTYC